MQTEFIQVNYAKAADISELLSAEQGCCLRVVA